MYSACSHPKSIFQEVYERRHLVTFLACSNPKSIFQEVYERKPLVTSPTCSHPKPLFLTECWPGCLVTHLFLFWLKRPRQTPQWTLGYEVQTNTHTIDLSSWTFWPFVFGSVCVQYVLLCLLAAGNTPATLLYFVCECDCVMASLKSHFFWW